MNAPPEISQNVNIPGRFLFQIRRRTVGGNFIGICFCFSYFTLFDTVYAPQKVAAILTGAAIMFFLQVSATGVYFRFWLKDILRFLEKAAQGVKSSGDEADAARRKILNLPFMCGAVSLINWLLSAIFVPLICLFVGGLVTQTLAAKLCAGILIAGLSTGAIVFFRVEALCKKTYPLFFPKGSLVNIPGTMRLGIGSRLIVSLTLISILPVILMAVVSYNKAGKMLEQDPSLVLGALLSVIVFLIVVVFINVMVISRMIANSIVSPLENMEQAMKKIRNGDLDVQVPLTSNDELGAMEENFNAMVGVLRDRERMRHIEFELDKGRQIQEDFLPIELPQVNGWEIDACFFPAKQVSGDFYDAFHLPDGRMAFVIADVCDKGVGAALFMALCRSLIRVFSYHCSDFKKETSAGDDPAGKAVSVISYTNNYIAAMHGSKGMFATLFYGVLEPQTGALYYVNCGHEPLLIINDGALRETLRPTGPAVGLRMDMNFSSDQTIIQPGELLLGYTDGVIDARGPDGEPFSRKRLLDMAAGQIRSAHDLMEKLKSDLFSHIGDEHQFDDITMLAARRSGRHSSQHRQLGDENQT